MEPFGVKATLLSTAMSSGLSFRAWSRKSLDMPGSVAAFIVSFILVGTGTVSLPLLLSVSEMILPFLFFFFRFLDGMHHLTKFILPIFLLFLNLEGLRGLNLLTFYFISMKATKYKVCNLPLIILDPVFVFDFLQLYRGPFIALIPLVCM